jgi:hypothetical protein
MPGLGRRTFAPGEVLTATNVMGYLQDQAVMNFAGTAARGSAIGSAVSQGMVSYLDDSNGVEVYRTTGTAIAGWERIDAPLSPNVIINGAFEINQRAFTSTTVSGTYGFDRWRISSAGGTTTYSTQAFTPGTAPLTFFEGRNFARLVTSGQSGTDDFAGLAQRVEDVRTLAGQTVTFSFWAKAASGTPKVAVAFEQVFGTGGSSAVIVEAGQVTLSTSWARYSLTVAIPSISGKTVSDTNSSLYAWLFTSGGSGLSSYVGNLGVQNITVDFWGVQVEAGQTATPFRRNANSIQGELAACQRYYNRISATGFDHLVLGYQITTTTFSFLYQAPVRMRGTPSVSVTSIQVSDDSSYGSVPSSVTINTNTDAQSLSLRVNNASAVGAAFRPAVLRCSNATGIIEFSSEL